MRRLRRLPIRARLTLYYVVVFTLVLGGVGVFLVVRLQSTLRTSAQESLELSYRGVYEQVAGGTALGTVLRETEIPGEQGQPEVIGQILDANGAVVETSYAGVLTTPAVGAGELGQARSLGHWHGVRRLAGRAHDDVVFVLQFDAGSRRGQYLVLAQTLGPVSTATRRLQWLLLAVAPVAIAVAAAGGWAVARAGLRPVDELTRRAAGIDASKPHDPLPVPPADDELARLAATLNDMLGRLERALAAERRFTADASHELRTPLAVMEAELDVALRSRRTPPVARDVLLSVQDETSRLSRIVTNLLVLARSEATGDLPTERCPTELRELVDSVTARLRPAARQRDVELRVAGDGAVVAVDRDLFGQAVANLVDNAITHTDPAGTVTVTVGSEEDGATTIDVSDTGCGIAPDDLAHVFDRFYRADRSRDRRRGGSGLGLELTRRIVEAHGGRVEAVSAVGVGSTFTIRLPAGAPSPARPASRSSSRS